jgi:hypothetical protein
VGEALRLYQHALELDNAIGDQQASAEDWAAYGKFLDDAGFPARLAYACYVKAESLGKSLGDATSPEALVNARRQTEKRIGVEAAKLRANPEPTLREALALQR